MTIRNPCYDFSLQNPCLKDFSLNEECFVCSKTFPRNLKDPDLLPVRHHLESAFIHLKCCLNWIRKSDLCMFCKDPVNIYQIILLKDRLSKVPHLKIEKLRKISDFIKKRLQTPEGKLEAMELFRKKEWDSFKKAHLCFIRTAQKYSEQLKRVKNSLENQIHTHSKEIYLKEESLLQKTDLISSKIDYESALYHRKNHKDALIKAYEYSNKLTPEVPLILTNEDLHLEAKDNFKSRIEALNNSIRSLELQKLDRKTLVNIRFYYTLLTLLLSEASFCLVLKDAYREKLGCLIAAQICGFLFFCNAPFLSSSRKNLEDFIFYELLPLTAPADMNHPPPHL